jgi:hypothetical protein
MQRQKIPAKPAPHEGLCAKPRTDNEKSIIRLATARAGVH